MLRRLAASPSRALGAQHAVVVGGARQRGEDLLAVDDEAAVDRPRLGAERRRRRRPPRRPPRTAAHRSRRCRRCGGSACGGAALCAARSAGVISQIVGERARSTASSTHACSRTARSRRNSGRARPRRGNRSGSRRRGRRSAFGMQMREQALGMHVAEILDRKGRVAIVLRRARRQHAAAEPARLADQIGGIVGEPECVGGRTSACRCPVRSYRQRALVILRSCRCRRRRMAQKVENRGVEVARRLKIWQEARCRERFKLRVPGAGGGADAVKKDHRRSCVAVAIGRSGRCRAHGGHSCDFPGPTIRGRLTHAGKAELLYEKELYEKEYFWSGRLDSASGTDHFCVVTKDGVRGVEPAHQEYRRVLHRRHRAAAGACEVAAHPRRPDCRTRSGGPRQGRPRARRRRLRRDAGPGRRPHPPRVRRMDADAGHARLDRQLRPWRHHHHDLRVRAARARASITRISRRSW